VLPAIHFEVHGHGPALILAYPITASEVPESPGRAATNGYLARLTDRYQVLVMDYPNIGKSEPILATELTADRVCADMLRVADSAGFQRFAWWGYSWGGLIGLLLAGRTDRLTALVCGGWPPLGGLSPLVLESCRATASTLEYQKQYVTFYESLQGWSEENSVRRITCPRLTYVGSQDEVERGGVRMLIAATLRRHRKELAAGGWHVCELPGRDHSLWKEPNAVVPIVRPFLDSITDQNAQR
jgi:hypothetical protein